MNPRQKPTPPEKIDRRHFLKTAGLLTGAATLTGADALAGGTVAHTDGLARLMEAHDRAAADRYGRILAQGAAREGVRIRTDLTAIATKHNALVVAAPAEGLERIDPIRLREGIVQGVCYLSLSSRGSRPGFYAVKARAPQGVTLGEIPVLVDYIENRRTLFTVPGTGTVTSLTVPTGAGANVELGLGIDLPDDTAGPAAGRKLPICWKCPNGVTICVEHDPDAPMPPA